MNDDDRHHRIEAMITGTALGLLAISQAIIVFLLSIAAELGALPDGQEAVAISLALVAGWLALLAVLAFRVGPDVKAAASKVIAKLRPRLNT